MTTPAGAAPTAEKICCRFKPSAEALALLQPNVIPHDFAARLLDAGLYKDALGFAACCLGKREVVWWGCLCVWHVRGRRLAPRDEAAVHAAVRWVLDPKEELRQAAANAGEVAGGTSTFAGALALAAGWSGGSLAPAGLPAVAPPEFLTNNTVAGAILAVATVGQPGDLAGACRQFLHLAKDVASGQNRWDKRPGPVPR